jgi:hypothetical protein
MRRVCQALCIRIKSGVAAPHSTTQARYLGWTSRRRFAVQRADAAFLIRAGNRCKVKSLPDSIAAATQEITERRLTNAGAQESPIVLQTDPAAGEKLCDGRDRFSVVARTGTDCQDEITQ